MRKAGKWALAGGAAVVVVVAALVIANRPDYSTKQVQFAWSYPFLVNSTCTTGQVQVKALPSGGLLMFDDNGRVDWLSADGQVLQHSFDSKDICQFAELDPAGNLLMTTSGGYLRLYKPGPQLLWSTRVANEYSNSRPTFGADGLIHCQVDSGEMVSLTSDGEVVKRTKLSSDMGWPLWFGVDSALNSYMTTGADELVVFDNDGNVRWSYPVAEGYECAIEIAPGGVIIITEMEGYLKVLNPDGSLRWQFPKAAQLADGLLPSLNFSLLTQAGDILLQRADQLYLFTVDGGMKWSVELPGTAEYSLYAVPSLIESASGTLYVEVEYQDGLQKAIGFVRNLGQGEPLVGSAIVAVSPEGRLLWCGTIGQEFVLGRGCGSEGELYGFTSGDILISTGFSSSRQGALVRIDPPELD